MTIKVIRNDLSYCVITKIAAEVSAFGGTSGDVYFGEGGPFVDGKGGRTSSNRG